MTDDVVVKDQWGQIIFDDVRNTLELKWLPSTRDATDDDVRETMKLLTAGDEGRRCPQAPRRRAGRG
jgi:hypothetical protein